MSQSSGKEPNRLEWLAAAFSALPIGVVVCSAQDQILHANPAFASFLRYAEGSVLVGHRLADHFLEPAQPGRRSPDGPTDVAFRRSDETVAWGRLIRSVIQGQNGELMTLVSVEDVTHSRAPRTSRDGDVSAHGLTDLVTRGALLSVMDQELAPLGYGTCSLLLVNVDRLGPFNDAVGHPAGDQLLDTMASRLRLATRFDDVVCRLGGDEFAVLLRTPATEKEAVATAERLLALVGRPMDIVDQAVVASVSIGIAVSGPTSTVPGLLREADEALVGAKAGGRNRYEVFDPTVRAEAVSRSRLEGELRIALHNNELELHYQPEVDLVTGEVLAVEALVRWPHPDLGVLAADRFVILAEEAGIVADLGSWVLRTACETLQRPSELAHIALRVNVSAQQLRSSFVDDVGSVLAATSFEPSRLCLEITETAVMTDVDCSLRVLAKLHDLGVQLAIDDFGTGFSSLAYLKRFPVEILKIDRSFVDDVADPEGRVIVASVLSLAASLNLDVIAEGVETKSQRDTLTELGCRRAQGHYFSPARAEEDLLLWLSTRNGPDEIA